MSADAIALRQLAAELAGQPRVRTLGQLMADSSLIDPPEETVPYLVRAGRTTLLAGPPKGGKSTLASAAAAKVSAGQPFLGKETVQGPVLIVALDEHVGELVRRLPRFGADPELVYICDDLGKGKFGGLEAAICAVEPRLTVVDALYRLADAAGISEPGQSSGWSNVLDPLVQTCRKVGCGGLLLHHARKSDGRYRDSTAIGAAVDSIVELHPSKDLRERMVRTEARWSVEPFSISLLGNLSEEESSLSYELAGDAPSLDARIPHFVSRNLGCSGNALRKGVEGRGRDIDDTRDALITRGVLENRGSRNRMALFPGTNPRTLPPCLS